MKILKKIQILFLILTGASGKASPSLAENFQCRSHSSSIESILELSHTLQNSVQEQTSSTSPCPPVINPPPLVEEMENWLRQWSQTSPGEPVTPVKKNFSDFLSSKGYLDNSKHPIESAFKNENPKMIQLFRRLAKNSGSFPTDCHNVLCAARQLFGEKQGVQALYMLAKYGFNSSPYPFRKEEDREFWNSDELDRVLSSLSVLPKELLPVVYNRPLLRFKRDHTLTGHERIYGTCLMANSFIQIFDCGFKSSDQRFTNTIIHEIAHVIGGEGNIDRSPTWLSFSGWKETKTYENGQVQSRYTIEKPECIISKYSKTSPKEDFAESVALYWENPKLLKSACPIKYYYIQDLVFNGFEYKREC